MDKKAQIADGMVWMVATIFIFLIMLFFTGNLATQSLTIDKNKVGFGSGDEYKPAVDFKEAGLLIDFFEENEEVVFDWADNSKINKESASAEIHMSKLGVNTRRGLPEEDFVTYQNLYNAYVSFIEPYGFKEPYFYIRTQDQDLRILQSSTSSLNFDGRLTFGDSFERDFRPKSEDAYIERFFITSNDGNLILFVFYDQKSKDDFVEENG